MTSTHHGPASLTPIASQLWGSEHDLFLPGGVHFRGRMTVLRLGDGSLVLHSPIPIDDQLARSLAELGPVKHLIAPNAFHHVHLTKVLERYPQATLHGPRALAAKRTDLAFSDLDSRTASSWTSELQPLLHAGAPKFDEVVFLHAATRTLLVTDYFFNIHECRGWLTPWVLRTSGAYKKFAQSRWWRWIVQDKVRARESAEQMLAWPFERIIPAHGEIVTERAHERAERALSWLIGSAPKALPRPADPHTPT
ncbi:MAG TPA: DUF4336 domain-containing protein [Polyangiaceae bacterium]|nr:DUF4336 domain-containing protein [Polyangiaceae bacterium]